MIKLNEEQIAARALQKANIIIGILAFIPALLCWLFAYDMWIAYPHHNSSEKAFFAYASILLLAFYAYTIFSPRIDESENYSKQISGAYWILVLITNLLTALLFISKMAPILAVIPAIPFLFALNGMVAHYKLSNSNHVSNHNSHEA